MSITFFSDGGGIRDSHAAAACIVENDEGERARLIAYLGGATNNEAEITAGLLGFAFLKAIQLPVKDVKWVADSEYALKSATGYIFGWQKNGWKTAAKKPVKNQGLWKSFLSLSKGIKISSEHVRGHTGHPENEAVDSASTWAQRYAEDLLADGDSGAWVEPLEDGELWLLLDAREFIAELRSDGDAQPSEEQRLFLAHALSELEVVGFEQFASDAPSKEAPDKDEMVRRKIGKKLTALAKDTKALSDKSEAKSLQSALNQIIRDFELGS